jgi:hypothetical protein
MIDDLIDVLIYKFMPSFRVLYRAFKYSGTALPNSGSVGGGSVTAD